MRGGVAGRLIDLPGAEVGLAPRRPGAARGRAAPGARSSSTRRAGSRVALERRRRDAALARDLDPLLEQRALGVVGERRTCSHAGCIQSSQRRGLDDRAGEAVVVGVGVGADESRTSSSRSPAWASARSSWRRRPSPPIPVSKRTMPPSAATAQALPCGTPGQGSGRRSRQTPGRTLSARGWAGRRFSVIGASSRLDQVGGLLADHDRRRVGVAAGDHRHHRGVGDAQALDPADPQLRDRRPQPSSLPMRQVPAGW